MAYINGNDDFVVVLGGEGGAEKYPVGSIYISAKDGEDYEPAKLFGGTWAKISGYFLFGAGAGIDFGTRGGARLAMLTEANLPPHSHAIIGNGRYLGYQGTLGTDSYWGLSYVTEGTSSPWETSKVGSGASFSIMPPYRAVNIWERVE